jgi:hypothetical protein
MKPTLLLLLVSLISISSFAGTVSGTVTEKNGRPLPFASVLIKGTATGTTANSKGQYSMEIKAGHYTLICQHVGHKAVEQKVTVGKEGLTVDFSLEEQQYNITGVVVKAGREDPAYEIIRQAIKKRPDYLKEIKKFQCEVYLKGQMQLRSFPKNFMGQKVDFEDGDDSSKRKMLFLSESVARYSVEEPNEKKVEVLSTRVSGQSDGYGFSSPQIISFYENNISVGRNLNPRGFVSPISSNALNFYRYKFEGTFFENGKEINRIKVIPKRKYEPLFTGYINIMENEWRIHSVQLTIVKEQQMQYLDTLAIEQIYVPLKNVWVIKQQVIYPAGKIFSFDFFGSFVQVYDKFDIEPAFTKKFFGNTIMKFFDSSNKKSHEYWDSIRPIPLLETEAKDYKKKDSLEQARKDPKYLDSLDRKRNKFKLTGLILSGKTFSNQKEKSYFTIEPLISNINYNTVEGIVYNFSPSYSKSYEGRKSLYLSPDLRYGFSNHHFNAHLTGSYSFGKKYPSSISFSGGKRVFQFNNAQPISPRDNTLSTLQYVRNYMKIYEAWFGSISYNAGVGNGVNVYGNFQFQDRLPLDNLADMTKWRKNLDGREFTPNYPTELTSSNMVRHQAAKLTVGATWRPGTKYIELPDRKIALRSKYPTFNASITQGIKDLFGSDVDYTKWNFSISDNLDMKLGGRFSYRTAIGGFLNDKAVQLPDYQHFQGNRIALATPYLASFQLAPYYQYSNTEPFYATMHAEYHLNGLLTNKIPLLRKWNWFFVVGGNGFYVNKHNHYYEAMFSIENIFKVIRVDFVQGFQPSGNTTSGVRLSLPGFLSGRRED